MNLNALGAELAGLKELLPLGRTLCQDGLLLHVMGLALGEDGSLCLLLLQHDGEGRPAEPCPGEDRPATNREMLLSDLGLGQERPSLLGGSVQKVSIGGRLFSSVQSCSSFCGGEPWERAALFSRFLLAGWNPGPLGPVNLDSVSLTRVTLEGRYPSLPPLDRSAPVRLFVGPDGRQRLVQQPLTLSVGACPQRLTFGEGPDGPRWALLNRFCVRDMRREMEELFDSPEMKERFSPGALAGRRRELASIMDDVCPPGMGYGAVEYECQEGITLQFHTRAYLDGPPSCSGRAIGFIVSPEQGSVGRLGLRLQAALMAQPIPLDAQTVEAELFSFTEEIPAHELVV